MIAIGVLLLAFTIFTIVGGFVITTPIAQISFLPAAYCITMAISLVLVLSFDPKTVSSSSTGSSNTSFSRANSQRMSRTNSQVNSGFKNVEAREVKSADAVDPKQLAEKLDEVKESGDSSASSSESSDEQSGSNSPSSKQQLKQVQADDDEESSDEGSDVESQSD